MLCSILSLTFRYIRRLNIATRTTSMIASATSFVRANGIVFMADTRCRLCFVFALFFKLYFLSSSLSSRFNFLRRVLSYKETPSSVLSFASSVFQVFLKKPIETGTRREQTVPKRPLISKSQPHLKYYFCRQFSVCYCAVIVILLF